MKNVPFLKRVVAGLCLLMFISISLGVSGPVWAQEADLSREKIGDLIQTLENDQQRQEFIDNLKTLEAAYDKQNQPAEKSGLIHTIRRHVHGLNKIMTESLKGVNEIPSMAAVEQSLRQSARLIHNKNLLPVTLKILVVLGFAILAEMLMRLPLQVPQRRVLAWQQQRGLVGGLMVGLEICLDMVPLAIFGLVAWQAAAYVELGEVARQIVLLIILGNVAVRFLLSMARSVLAIHRPQTSILGLSDEVASYLYIWVRRLGRFGIYGHILIEIAMVLGLPPALSFLLKVVVGLGFTLMVILLVLQNRVRMAQWLSHHALPQRFVGLRRLVSPFLQLWYLPALAYVISFYFILLLNLEEGALIMLRGSIWMLIIIPAAIALHMVLQRALVRGFRIAAELESHYPGLEYRANRYLSVIETILTLLVIFFAGLFLLKGWGVHSFNIFTSPWGSRMTEAVLSIGLIVLLMVVVWEFINTFIENRLRVSDGPILSSRAKTLLPLIRNFIWIVLVTMALLVSLSELGVDIAPLLAGAGVVGLAVGFGAQTLVKDVITGLFIIIEDTIHVGDVVEVGGRVGGVERMTLRTIVLRDLTGSQYTVPFSNVTDIKNLTKDFSYCVFNVPVAYDENLEQVVKVMTDIGAKMQEDKTFGPHIIDPIDIQGPIQFSSFAVMMRGRIKTLPGKQWLVEREFNRRLKKRFDKLGIQISTADAKPMVISETSAARLDKKVQAKTKASKTMEETKKAATQKKSAQKSAKKPAKKATTKKSTKKS